MALVKPLEERLVHDVLITNQLALLIEEICLGVPSHTQLWVNELPIAILAIRCNEHSFILSIGLVLSSQSLGSLLLQLLSNTSLGGALHGICLLLFGHIHNLLL